ncbi:MAG: hypothetical protein M3259_03775 [Actinomycetota bacterium]|nr:hypothetical protein [Actinomycetota bacterium]
MVGIAQRITRKATSIGGIVLVHGEKDLVRVLSRVYDAMNIPMRLGSVGSLCKAGSKASVEDAIAALAQEARLRYDTTPVPLDAKTLRKARYDRAGYLVQPPA